MATVVVAMVSGWMMVVIRGRRRRGRAEERENIKKGRADGGEGKWRDVGPKTRRSFTKDL